MLKNIITFAFLSLFLSMANLPVSVSVALAEQQIDARPNASPDAKLNSKLDSKLGSKNEPDPRIKEALAQHREKYTEEDFRLKSRLDTLALALGNLVEGMEPHNQQMVLIKAIDGIPVNEDYVGYISLWQGTIDTYSPPTPDSAGLDFAHIKDLNGCYFVQDMFDKVNNNGGFVDYAMNSWDAKGWVLRRAYVCLVPNSSYWLMSWRIIQKDEYKNFKDSKFNSAFTNSAANASSFDPLENSREIDILRWFVLILLIACSVLVLIVVYKLLFTGDKELKNKRQQ